MFRHTFHSQSQGLDRLMKQIKNDHSRDQQDKCWTDTAQLSRHLTILVWQSLIMLVLV